MKSTLLLVVLTLTAVVFGQEHLTNTYTTKKSIAGGIPDSGTSTTIQYTFVANENIVLVNIKTKVGPLQLSPNDTLTIYLNSYVAYNFRNDIPDDIEQVPMKPRSSFIANLHNEKYFINIAMSDELKNALKYTFKGQIFEAISKEDIDESSYLVAP